MRPLLLLLALLTLCGARFTLPSTDADSTSCSSASPLTGLRYVLVHAKRQSPTWLAKRDSMLAEVAAWDRYWPTVRDEAALFTLSRTPILASQAGQPFVFTPGLPWRPAFVYVSTEDDSGNVSCLSNGIWVE